MKQLLFVVYDSKAHAWCAPFAGHSEADAQMAFGALCVDGEHPFGKHPADYTLYTAGEWDTTAGEYVAFEVKNNLGNGIAYVRGVEPQAVASGGN